MNYKKLLNVDIFKTIKLQMHNGKQGIAIVFRNSAIHLSKLSKVKIAGRFEFGRRYYPQDNRSSALSMADNAKLVITDDEQIYTGAYITVGPNAELSFGGGGIVTII